MFLKRDSLPVQVREENVTVVASDLPRDIQASSKPLENKNPEESAVRLSMSELRQLQQSGAPILILDARSDRNFESSEFQAQGALRFSPDQAVQRIADLQIPRQTWLIAFCA
jgi:hypothetical protein